LRGILGELYIAQAGITIPDCHILEALDNRLIGVSVPLLDLSNERCEVCIHPYTPSLLVRSCYYKPHLQDKRFHAVNHRAL
jgi:hypothetical protein